MEYTYFHCIPMAVFDTATLTGTYASMNGAGFLYPIKLLKIYNGSTVGVTVSYSGTTDEDYFPAGATQIFDIQANHRCNANDSSGQLTGRQGQIMYAKGTAGTGNLYIIGYL